VIAPHWHPNDKRVTVLQGRLLMGHGSVLDTAATHPMQPGDWSLVPARTAHYEGASIETVVLLYGTGPLTTTFVAEAAPPHIVAPRAPSPVLNGVVDAREWQPAARLDVPGGQLRLMQDDGTLYVAVAGTAPLLPTVCVAAITDAEPDTVWVLHASASLGDARYAVDSTGRARRLSGFSWRTGGNVVPATQGSSVGGSIRTDTSPASERRGERWTATTFAQAAGAREYALASSLHQHRVRMAVAWGSPLGTGARWPAGVTDQCSDLAFATGSAPETAQFRLQGWATVEIPRP
jgi:hypothetical protein